jgi:virginiamycin B lyase
MRKLCGVKLIVSLLVAAAAGADTPVEIKEWPVPWKETRPRDPAVDKSGIVWFVGQEGDYLGRFDPKTANFERFELEKGTGPHNCIVGPDGAIWFAGNRAGYIGRFDPSTKKIAKIAMPDSAAHDPHTLIAAPDGSIWFTVQAGGFVGRLDPKSREVKLTKISQRGARPYGIVVDKSGKVWFNEFGRNILGSIDPKTMSVAEHILPDGARDRRIALAAGAVWYVDYARGFLGRLDPGSGATREWQTPGGKGSLPYAMGADDQGRLWFVETGPQPNRLVGFEPKTSSFFSVTPILPSGASTVRHMVFDPARRAFWFGTDAGTLVRASLP